MTRCQSTVAGMAQVRGSRTDIHSGLARPTHRDEPCVLSGFPGLGWWVGRYLGVSLFVCFPSFFSEGATACCAMYNVAFARILCEKFALQLVHGLDS